MLNAKEAKLKTEQILEKKTDKALLSIFEQFSLYDIGNMVSRAAEEGENRILFESEPVKPPLAIFTYINSKINDNSAVQLLRDNGYAVNWTIVTDVYHRGNDEVYESTDVIKLTISWEESK